MFAPAQILWNWCKQRPSNKGDFTWVSRGRRLGESVRRAWTYFWFNFCTVVRDCCWAAFISGTHCIIDSICRNLYKDLNPHSALSEVSVVCVCLVHCLVFSVTISQPNYCHASKQVTVSPADSWDSFTAMEDIILSVTVKQSFLSRIFEPNRINRTLEKMHNEELRHLYPSSNEEWTGQMERW